jgi:glucose-1-phosphate thymidylyltransferase
MIYYPLSTLMLAGIRDILIITTPDDGPRFESLLRDGSELGVRFRYAVQPRPEGVAQALIVGEDFIGQDRVALILGDNLFFGHGFPQILQSVVASDDAATIFAYAVRNPERYGVITFDERGEVAAIDEKPAATRSRYAIPGLYFYDSSAPGIARGLRPSQRGEIEITDVNRAYLERGLLRVRTLGRGIAWLDTGTHESLMQAATFVESIEGRQGLMIGSIEEVAFHMGYITSEQLERRARSLERSDYGQYLMRLAEERR